MYDIPFIFYDHDQSGAGDDNDVDTKLTLM